VRVFVITPLTNAVTWQKPLVHFVRNRMTVKAKCFKYSDIMLERNDRGEIT
jgi:hypothetical protein